MKMAGSTLRLHASDNVAVALVDIAAGATVAGEELSLADDVPAGHKFALQRIAAGEVVRKFGQVIGVATETIEAGRHVHTFNLSAQAGLAPASADAPDREGKAMREPPWFDGYRRDGGGVGTRNYVGIVSTVNCSATVIRRIADQINKEGIGAYENVDGICPITHSSGCGMSARGSGMGVLRRTLGGYLRHPNFGAILVVGLGCEANDIAGLLNSAACEESDTLRTMSIQDVGGTRAAIEQGVAIVRELLAAANRARRERSPASAIRLGLQCGGSDSFSGITANPALGVAADRIVAAGGTVILGETPEIHGAEHLLLSRAASPAVADALLARLEWWERYVAMHGEALDNNPSPGNLAGGITTILEKSLGAVMKAGTTPLRQVLDYAEPATERGFVFMDSPGYDPCSVTGEIASGANMICFTTGRGSVFGAKPVPSIKLASNSAMAKSMADDIDYDCGAILSGARSLDEAGLDILRLILATASGERSASEDMGLGDFEFVPWQLGAVL